MKTFHLPLLCALWALIFTPVTSLQAGETDVLLQILVRKGLLTAAEAAEVKAEMHDQKVEGEGASTPDAVSPASLAATRPPPVRVAVTKPGSRIVDSFTLYGRLQMQYVSLDSDRDMGDTNRFLVRRARIGAKVVLASDWLADIDYTFSSGDFNKAVIGWGGDLGFGPIAIQAGLRKPYVGYEENTSSGSLNAIERSAATRFFTESNNGRRLGAAGYRVGIYLDGNPDATKGKVDGVYYGLAVTNPERPSDAAGAASTGISGINTPATWANLGYAGRVNDLTYTLGAGAGYLPDSGGRVATAGNDLVIYSVYGDVRFGAFRVGGEYLTATVDGGIGAGTEVNPEGFWLQTEYAFNAHWLGAVRYSRVDSDGRGVRTSDGLRSAPSALVGDTLDELYAGFNYDIMGSDLRFQLGYVYGHSVGPNGSETISGVRSQVQVNF